ncbi:MAG: M61 family metallopeptidase [bacterium]|jgi:predicted metalloprotease with PDZ domain|nr:PDZ domain-containing protein [Betaproteobacteria bacterium]
MEKIHYLIVPVSPEAHRFQVTLQVSDPDPAGQRLWLPVWIPGSYLVREFARHVLSIAALDGQGRPVAVAKVDKHRWQCAPCESPLTVTCEVYAWDLSVRAAHLDTMHAYFNGSSVFLAVEGREHEHCTVDIQPPAGEAYGAWRVATTLPRAGAPEHGFGRYRAADYDELIDHPVECGTFDLVSFDAHGVRHDIAVTGRHRGDLDRLARDFARACTAQIDLFGAPPPFDRYLFQVMVVGDGYGGLEHRASTSLLCSRDDLPQPGQAKTTDKYRTLLGLASHEYFHAWNVKRIKPAAFLPYDLSREGYTRQLWAFEGITSYYDDLALVRCGLVTPDEYLQMLGETVTRVLRGAGRLKQSVAESSFDAWIKFYRPDENAPNAVVSYYTKGSLVALALDLTLREATGGARSLDDLMRRLWQDYGARGIGVPEDRIPALASEIAGRDLSAFFALAVDGTEDLPLAALLATVGVKLGLRAATGESDKGGTPGPLAKVQAEAVAAADDVAVTSAAPLRPWLGARLSADGKVSLVHDGSPAQQAGLSAGDQIVAIDGLRFAGIEALLSASRPGRALEVHAFRRDELYQCRLVLAEAPLDTAWLVVDADAAPDAVAARAVWLDTAAPPK